MAARDRVSIQAAQHAILHVPFLCERRLGWEFAELSLGGFTLKQAGMLLQRREGETHDLERWEHLVITLEAIGMWLQGEEPKYHPETR